MRWPGADLHLFDSMKWMLLGEAQWDVHSKVFDLHSNNLLLISAASGFLCVSGHTMASALLLFFFCQVTKRLDSFFSAAAASAQAIIKMFSQWLFCSRVHHSVELKSKRVVENTGHCWVDRTAMITAPQNSIKLSKRTQNTQSETLGRSCADTLAWIHSEYGYL